MLNAFPYLLAIWPIILRVIVGFIFVYFGITKIWKERSRRITFFKKVGFGTGIVFFWLISIVELIGGAFLVLGFFTQIVALILSLVIIGAIYTKIRHNELLDNTLEFFILLLAILIFL